MATAAIAVAIAAVAIAEAQALVGHKSEVICRGSIAAVFAAAAETAAEIAAAGLMFQLLLQVCCCYCCYSLHLHQPWRESWPPGPLGASELVGASTHVLGAKS